MKRALLLATAILFAFASNAVAATKTTVAPLTINNLVPTVTTNFSGGDQVSALLTSPSAIYLVGTAETNTSQLLTFAPLGGSDGYIIALNSNGSHSWDLRLGTSGDDIASTGYVDITGNIWVAGASAVATSAAPAAGLNRLTVWEISPAGLLLNTFTKDLTDVDIPTSITLKGANFIVQGVSSRVGAPTFTLSMTPLGKLGSVKNSPTKPIVSSQIFSATSAAYGWLSYVSPKPIGGVLGMPLHQSTTVLIKSSLKDRSLKGIYSVQGAPISLTYQSGIGVVELTSLSGSYLLTVIHTK